MSLYRERMEANVQMQEQNHGRKNQLIEDETFLQILP